MKYYFYSFKNPMGRRASVSEFITMPGFKGKRKRGLTLTLYKNPFRYRLPVSPPRKQSSSIPNLKSSSIRTPKQISSCIRNVLYQDRSPQAGKRENRQFVDLSRLQFTSDESEFIPSLAVIQAIYIEMVFCKESMSVPFSSFP
jgi:hypothetical protein